jgi:hypothetical protein
MALPALAADAAFRQVFLSADGMISTPAGKQ